MHFELLSSVGMLPIVTVGAVGIQGATVMGMQGMGVSTPSAAAVAAATMGLEGVMHTPNGMMLSIGTKSMMFAAGMLPAMVVLMGRTVIGDGAAPNVHESNAPFTTWSPMLFPNIPINVSITNL